MEKFNKDIKAWCVTDGSAGMNSQVKGLAEAMKINYELRSIDLRFPWSVLPVGILPIFPSIFKNLGRINLSDTPDFLITCGRQSVYFSLYLKRKLGKKIFNIHIQNPKVNLNEFDLIIAPTHDNLTSSNVINADLAINQINPEIINSNIELFKKDFSNIDEPICCVLIGGKSRNYIFDKNVLEDLTFELKNIQSNNKLKLIILSSRRTDQFIINHLNHEFGDSHIAWNENNNPYIALLGISKFIICTSDSVSMISEAIYSRKSVFIYRLKSSKNNNRIEDFINSVIDKGFVKLIPNLIEEFAHNYKNETEEVARRIHQMYTDLR